MNTLGLQGYRDSHFFKTRLSSSISKISANDYSLHEDYKRGVFKQFELNFGMVRPGWDRSVAVTNKKKASRNFFQNKREMRTFESKGFKMLFPATFFEFLPTSAGAGVVASDFRLIPDKRFGGRCWVGGGDFGLSFAVIPTSVFLDKL